MQPASTRRVRRRRANAGTRRIVAGGAALIAAVLLETPARAEPMPNAGRLDACSDCYLDRAGQVRQASADYEALTAEHDPAYFRAALEELLFLGVGTAYYWLYRERNVADWDDPSLRARLSGDAWRYDNNALPVNYLLHPATGMGAYMLARGNRIGVPASFAYSFAASFAWEWGVEFREKVSLNDTLVTPGAGLAFGEFFHKLGRYLDSTPNPGAMRSALQWSPIGLSVRAHRALDGLPVTADRPRDSLGMSSDIWHAFEFGYRAAASRTAGHRSYPVHGYFFAGRLVSIPGYLRAGSFDRFFSRADLTALELYTEHSSRGVGLTVVADTVLLGQHWQRITSLGRSARQGWAVTLGTSVGASYHRSKANGFDEQLGALHLPGLAADWHGLTSDFTVGVHARLNPDFVGAGATAYSDWEADNSDEVGKSILRKQGYFHGWGGSARVGAEVAYGPVALSGSAFYGQYWSQQGLDRAPDLVTADVRARAHQLRASGALLVTPPGVPAGIGIEISTRRQGSTVENHSRREAADAVGGLLKGRF